MAPGNNSNQSSSDLALLHPLENLDIGYLASVDGFRFVRISKIRSWHRWKRWQDLEDSDYELSNGCLTDIENHLYFISHRWLTKDHPDPEGTQLERIKQLADEDALLFYDYCSLPQEPRNDTEQFLFDTLLEKLNTILPKMKVIILKDEEYMERSWCMMEYFISAFHGSIICDQLLNSNMIEIHSLACSLPPDGQRSVLLSSEVRKAGRMGAIAHWFFELFQRSHVTKGSDKAKIKHILSDFVAQNIKFLDYVSHNGWQPRHLNSQEVDDILNGRPVRLVAINLPDDLGKFNRQTGDHMGKEPAASFTRDMEEIWEHNRSRRLANRFGTYWLLNNGEAKLNLKK